MSEKVLCFYKSPIVKYCAHSVTADSLARIRVSNPGPVFSSPGFGIGEFLIPGSRRDYGIPAWYRASAQHYLADILHLNLNKFGGKILDSHQFVYSHFGLCGVLPNAFPKL